MKERIVCKKFSDINKDWHKYSTEKWGTFYIEEYDKKEELEINKTTNELYIEIRKVREEFEKFKKENEHYKKISDLEAKNEIMELLKILKRGGKSKIDFFEIATFLKLPLNQTGKILNQLEDEGFIKEE